MLETQGPTSRRSLRYDPGSPNFLLKLDWRCSLKPRRAAYQGCQFMARHVHFGLLAASLSVVRLVAGLYLASLIPLFVSLSVAAERCPSRPIRLLIGFPPGGPADIPGRAIA